MNPRFACLLASLVLLAMKLAFSQETPSTTEVKSILREASTVIPAMKLSQRATSAANIAAEQTRAGDDEGALATRAFVQASDQSHTVGGIAYSLAARGRLEQALKLISDTTAGQEKAVAYWQVTEALLSIAKYNDALAVARLISKDPRETARFLDCLLQIYRAQLKTGDSQRAATTLSEALRTVESEPTNPQPTGKFWPTTLIYSRRPAMFRAIVHTLALTGNLEVARTVVARISTMAAEERNPERRKGILGPLAAAQADVGDFTAALRTVEPIKSDFFNHNFITAIATEKARQGDVPGALAILTDIPQGLSLPALLEISRVLVDSGRYAGARAVVDKISSQGERAYGLADLAFNQAAKDPVGAKNNLELAWKLAYEARDRTPPYMFQNAMEDIAATRARLRDFEGAVEIIDSPDLQAKAWPVAVLAQMMVEAGDKKAALALANNQATPIVRADGLLQVARSLLDQIDPEKNRRDAPQ